MVPFPGGFTDTGPQQWNGTKRMNMCETSTGDPTNTCEVELSGGGGMQSCYMQLGQVSVKFSNYCFREPIFLPMVCEYHTNLDYVGEMILWKVKSRNRVKSLVSPLVNLVTVLVSIGCHNKIPETTWLKQLEFISHSSVG